MAEIDLLNKTDASNTDRFPEGQAPSTVNNGARALEGMLARFFFDLQGSSLPEATLSGSVIQFTANRTSITMTSTTSNYVPWSMFGFRMGASGNTGPASVRINDIQTLSLRDNRGSSLGPAVIPAGSVNFIMKDHANNYFRLLGAAPMETGTFTPTIAFGGAAVGVTYSNQTGFYWKQGTLLWFILSLSLTSKGSSTGAAVLGGLPYAAADSGVWIPITPISLNLDVAGGYYSAFVTTTAAATTLSLNEAGDNVASAALTDADVSDTSTIVVQGLYRV